MFRPTLNQFRLQWPAEAMGVCQADPMVAAYCNESQERLLMDPMTPEGGWWGGTVTMNLTVYATNGHAYVTTPAEIASLVVMGVCQTPVNIRNGFYEYLSYGNGLQPKSLTCGSTCYQPFQAYERDNVFTFTDLLPIPQKVRIYISDARDATYRVLLQGKDQNLLTIYTSDPLTGTSAPGEYLTLASPFVDSVNQFSSITGIQKDQTYGPLQFFQVDPTSGAENALSTMEPNEGAANYRRYLINGIPINNLCCTGLSSIQVSAQGRLDFVPVQNETDYLIIPNVPALIEESLSIRFSRMESDNASKQSLLHHARALALLNGQLDTYTGKTNTAISLKISGLQGRRAQPI
jgi:hypothetical protein